MTPVKCVLCGKLFSEYGNNAKPLKEGICCDVCNDTKVVPERNRIAMNTQKQYVRIAKKFGSGGCHITLPVKDIGKKFIITEKK